MTCFKLKHVKKNLRNFLILEFASFHLVLESIQSIISITFNTKIFCTTCQKTSYILSKQYFSLEILMTKI